jgi:hypothetical protein
VFGTEMLHVFRVRDDLERRQGRCVVVHAAGSTEFELARSLYGLRTRTGGGATRTTTESLTRMRRSQSSRSSLSKRSPASSALRSTRAWTRSRSTRG